jgi:hypothetical protein
MNNTTISIFRALTGMPDRENTDDSVWKGISDRQLKESSLQKSNFIFRITIRAFVNYVNNYAMSSVLTFPARL